MQGNPRKHNEIESENKFDFWRHFLWWKKGGIYVPKTEESEEKSQSYPTTVNIQSRVPIDPKRDKLIVAATIISTIISGLALWVVIKYTQAAFEQVTQTQIANQQARQASGDANALGNRNAGTAEKTLQEMQSERRAWVGVTSIDTTDVKVGQFTATVTIGNSGDSPALHTVIRNFVSGDICAQDFPDKPPTIAFKNFTPILLMPKAVISGQPIVVQIGEERMKELNAKKCGLYVYGTINYSDVSRCPHYRRFCGQWAVGTPKAFSICDKYNDGDEDYPADNPAKSCGY